MPEAYIVDAVRTPVGKRGGGLSQVHPADLGAHSLKALVDRTGIDPAARGDSDPFTGSKGWVERYGTQEVSQFRGAEMIAEKWGIAREEMERFAFESHQRAAHATDEGRFENEIVPMNGVTADEGFRRETTLE